MHQLFKASLLWIYLKFYCVTMSSGETPSLSFTVFDLKFTREWLVFEIRQITKISSLQVTFFPCIAAEFMQLTYDYIHLKADSNSKLNGYWTSDIGGLNEVTHIWEYGNFS